MALALDIITAVFILGTGLMCWRKGLVRTLFNFFGSVIALICAVVVASKLCVGVYNYTVKDKVVEAVKNGLDSVSIERVVGTAIERTDSNITVDYDELNSVVQQEGDIPDNVAAYYTAKGTDTQTADKIRNELDGYFNSDKLSDDISAQGGQGASIAAGIVSNNKDKLYDIVRKLAGNNNQAAAEYIEENFISSAATTLVKGILIVVLAGIFTLIIRLVVWISGIIDMIPIADNLNRGLGLLVGLLNGAVMVLVMAFVISAVVTATSNSLQNLNTDIIDNCVIFRYFFNIFY